jgi:FtsH Extracellular
MSTGRPSSSLPRGGSRPSLSSPTKWLVPLIGAAAFVVLLFVVPSHTAAKSTTKTLTYTQFESRVNADLVHTASITDAGTVTGTLTRGGSMPR